MNSERNNPLIRLYRYLTDDFGAYDNYDGFMASELFDIVHGNPDAWRNFVSELGENDGTGVDQELIDKLMKFMNRNNIRRHVDVRNHIISRWSSFFSGNKFRILSSFVTPISIEKLPIVIRTKRIATHRLPITGMFVLPIFNLPDLDRPSEDIMIFLHPNMDRMAEIGIEMRDNCLEGAKSEIPMIPFFTTITVYVKNPKQLENDGTGNAIRKLENFIPVNMFMNFDLLRKGEFDRRCNTGKVGEFLDRYNELIVDFGSEDRE